MQAACAVSRAEDRLAIADHDAEFASSEGEPQQIEAQSNDGRRRDGQWSAFKNVVPRWPVGWWRPEFQFGAIGRTETSPLTAYAMLQQAVDRVCGKPGDIAVGRADSAPYDSGRLA